MLTTTLKLLREHYACDARYRALCDALGGAKKYGDRTPIPLERILDLNGLDDAAWALRAVPASQRAERDRLARLFACDCAERVLPIFEAAYPDDKRPRRAIEVARRFVAGDATKEEMVAARGAARDSAWAVVAAAWTASAAARASGGAAWDDREAARAARVAARAARDAAWDDWDAERDWQEKRLRAYLRGEA